MWAGKHGHKLEKLCNTLQEERNNLSKKVEALKKQGPVEAADVALATPVIHAGTTVDSQKHLNPSFKEAPGICLQDEIQ